MDTRSRIFAAATSELAIELLFKSERSHDDVGVEATCC